MDTGYKSKDISFRFIRFWLFILFYEELGDSIFSDDPVTYDSCAAIADHVCNVAYKRGLIVPVDLSSPPEVYH